MFYHHHRQVLIPVNWDQQHESHVSIQTVPEQSYQLQLSALRSYLTGYIHSFLGLPNLLEVYLQPLNNQFFSLLLCASFIHNQIILYLILSFIVATSNLSRLY